MNRLSSLPFFSCFRYTPDTNYDSKLDRFLRKSVGEIKGDRENIINRILDSYLKDPEFVQALGDFIGRDSVLVPVPSSTPTPESIKKPWLNVPLIISKALELRIPGLVTRECLKRERKIRKSSTSQIGNRPTIEEHLQTLAIRTEDAEFGLFDKTVVLVDDVITRGCTAFACAQLIEGVVSDVSIRVFTLVRTNRYEPASKQFFTGTLIRTGDTPIRSDW